MKVQGALLYVDSIMVAPTDPGWLQTTFDMLMGLFDRVGLKTNFRKTVGVACHICLAARVRADKYYTCWMTGTGRSYKERK